MKKIITTILIIISFAIFPLMVSASANKVTFKETSKGKLATTIHFEEGFVGGIDLTIKLEGNIKFEKFDFNNNITKKNYETYQTYDEKNKILNIKITTGGINSEHNLLNSNKELSLGNLILSSSAKNNVDYKLIINNLTYIDNSWKSVDINDITNKEQELIYKVTTESTNNDKTTTDKTEEDKKETNDKNDTNEDNKTTSDNKDNTTNNKNENNDKTTNDKNSNNSTSKDQTTNKDENNTQNNNVENNTSEENDNNEDNETEEEIENSSTDENNEKEELIEEEKSELNKKEIIIIIGVCIVIVSGAIISIIKIKR